MLIIAGIVPIKTLPLLEGRVMKERAFLRIGDYQIPATQGTAAMISAALAVSQYFQLESPRAVVAGDIGRGDGSRLIYQYLIQNLLQLKPRVLALHYCMPDLELMRQLYEQVKLLDPPPVLIADAASMYAAKAVGLASAFDVFTPDLSELAFLADKEEIHPAYIDKHLFESCDIKTVPEFIALAYENQGAARYLLVKGKADYIADKNGILSSIDGPDIPELECIGGTGDTITGMVAALIYKGLNIPDALKISAQANRLAGAIETTTPATRINEIIDRLPQVFKSSLKREIS
jgi:NAD(P)H-hydrate repair Nnr-like enzyme with NAD(P)H-hydrate dehydratase domain